MRKFFWFFFTRFKLWFLYRGVKIPYSERPEDYKCPTCNWNTTEEEYYSKSYLGSSDCHYGYEGSQYWTEHWKCPRCGTVFTVDNSD